MKESNNISEENKEESDYNPKSKQSRLRKNDKS